MNEYPDSLTEVKVEFRDFAFEKTEELWAEYYIPAFNEDQFVSDLEQIDPYAVSDFWYRRFGTAFYCGILSLEPWCYLQDLKYGLYEEESIWGILLERHLNVEDGVITFKWDKESRINGWLRTHSRDGDTATNVETLFRVAMKTVFNQDSSRREPHLWKWYPEGECKKCEMWSADFDETGRCPECGEDLRFPE